MVSRNNKKKARKMTQQSKAEETEKQIQEQAEMNKEDKQEYRQRIFNSDEFDKAMEKKHNAFVGVKEGEKNGFSYFSYDEQIERYAKTIAFLMNEELSIPETDPFFTHKKMLLSSRRLTILDRIEDSFDVPMQQDIFRKIQEINFD